MFSACLYAQLLIETFTSNIRLGIAKRGAGTEHQYRPFLACALMCHFACINPCPVEDRAFGDWNPHVNPCVAIRLRTGQAPTVLRDMEGALRVCA